jgi:DNA-binding winged helix-turn-helix (wHTH) protein/tetratricopeptide (TPR) repeat protein
VKSFLSFRLDPLNHCLWHGETRVSVSPKAFDLLRYLVERPARLISQEEILEALWPRSDVNPEIIKKYILGLRKVLGDQPQHPVFIETVPRRGYRFVAPVQDERVAPQPVLITPGRIVGRRQIRADLEACLQSSLRGQRQILFVAGEAGSGKTAVTDAFEQRAAMEFNVRAVRGHCLDTTGSLEAYYPLLEGLGSLVRGNESRSLLPALIRHAPTWAVQFPALLGTRQKEQLGRDALGATPERMLREICDALESLASTDPLLLVIEDVHWADSATLDFISALARRRNPVRIALVATYRPDENAGIASRLKSVVRDLLVHRLCRELILKPLTKADICEYVSGELSVETADAQLIDFIHDHCGGNPLFMVAIVQQLVQRGLLAQADGRWKLLTPPDRIEMGVPETLQQLLLAQFAQLSELEQTVLRAASVVGYSFSAWEITSATQMHHEAVERICEELADRMRFIRTTGIRELPNGTVSAHYEFLHALYREFLYSAISPVLRSTLHRSIAEQLQRAPGPQLSEIAAALVMHFEEGRGYERAIYWLMVMAEAAARRFAHRESIQLLQRGLALVSKLPTNDRLKSELQLLERLGDGHYALGEMAESVSMYGRQAEAAERVALPVQQAQALMCQAVPLGLLDPDRAISTLVYAGSVCESWPDEILRRRIRCMSSVWQLMYRTWENASLETYTSIRSSVELPITPHMTEHEQMFCLYVPCLLGHYAEAADAAGRLARETASLMGYLGASGVITLAQLFLGRLGNALEIIREARSKAEKNGYDSWLFVFREAWLRTIVFDFEGAKQLCDSIIQNYGDVPPGQPMTIARLAAGYIDLEAGRYGEALRHFADVSDPTVTPKFFLYWYWRLQAQLARVEVMLAANELAEARSEVSRLLTNTLKTAEPTLRVRVWDIDARVAIALGELEQARASIHEALAITRGFQVPLAAWRAHATASELAKRDSDASTAEKHRDLAREGIHALASDLGGRGPLLASLLGASAVRSVLG